MAKRTNILVARVSFAVVVDGKRVTVHRGKTTAHANHPIVRGREQYFRPLLVDYATDDEDDEPTPPKKRSPGRPKKQAEAKPEESVASKSVEQPALTDDEAEKDGE